MNVGKDKPYRSEFGMKIITRKSEVRILLKKSLETYTDSGLDLFIDYINKTLLQNKVKFPLLEFCAHHFFSTLAVDDQIKFCDEIEKLKTEGGNVLIGIMLQNQLASEYQLAIDKATEYISKANAWYVCDIIGGRVFGYSLLEQPVKTISEIKRLSKHKSYWVVRSLGAGCHYAIKKGLEKKYVNTIFLLLLTMANTNNKEIRQGVGWAGKTTAKFHPDIIDKHKKKIDDETMVANWFRRKVDIGLNRYNYAKRDNS